MREFTVKVTKWTAIKTASVIALMFVAFFAGACWTVPTAYKKGYEEGYVRALSDVQEILGQKGVVFNWKDLGNGKYQISVYFEGVLYAQGVAEVHLNVQHYRNGILVSSEWGAGVLTNIGKDWIEQQLADSNGTQEALYCADSNDATDPPLATWTQLPTEITTNGLERQTGAYTSTGTGAWNVTKTKSVTGTQSTQLWGLHWKTYAEAPDNCLLCADSGPTQKNCVNGDTLKETWQISVS